MFKIKNLKFERIYIFLSFFLFLFYFVTRLVNLTVIPVFCDEAIYVHWAQIMRAVQSLRFIPLSDGKQPLFMWLVIPFLKVFSDPLTAGRMVNVIAGFGSMLGVGFLSYLLFKKKEISWFASLMYLIVPFCLFFDRMALVDGLVSFLGVWTIIFFILLAKKIRLDLAMIGGILLGLGLLTKSPALFFALMLPITVIFYERRSKNNNIFMLIGLWVIVLLFGYAIYNILRLGPEFHMIAIRNKDYVFPISEIIKHPLNPLVGHLKDTLSWYWILLTPAVFLAGIAGVVTALKSNLKSAVLLLALVVFPLLGQGMIAKVYTARYVLFTVPFFLIFSAVSIEKFWQKTKTKWLVTGGLVIVFLLPMYQTFLLITVPQRAWLPKEERRGYLEIWTAGYGIVEAADFLKGVSKTQKVLVGTEGYFGTLPDGLQMYLEKVPNITIIGVGQPVLEISPKLIDGLVDNRVFLLVNDTRLKINNDPRLKLVEKYPKTTSSSGTQENLLLFEIIK